MKRMFGFGAKASPAYRGSCGVSSRAVKMVRQFLSIFIEHFLI
jgi:hypothetical protein